MFCLLQLPNTNQEAACNPKQDLDYKKVVQSRIAEMSILAFCKILGLEPKLVYQRFELRRVKHSVKYVAVAASSFHTWSLSHRLAGVEVYIYYKRIYIYIIDYTVCRYWEVLGWGALHRSALLAGSKCQWGRQKYYHWGDIFGQYKWSWNGKDTRANGVSTDVHLTHIFVIITCIYRVESMGW